ncbi:hypothetical protein QBC46DRAFT_400715 [Diplogelasinospora grovesii]|uniref:RING-type domain-containing protein n=1 Tax=Diplogelasinospora grovesii TaxID=303347 RepID=A0AAN6MXG3_9PEZI|nr:hypothetical protein QBC46DRAFT_400715 [Diplogelasinospora grovesii]
MSMTVDEIQNVVLLFSNPSWTGVGTVPSTVIRNITALSSQIAYSARITENITVLAPKYAETTNGVIQGLLYVPDLAADDPCVSETAPYVPKSAVRQADLPPTNYNLIGLAPWVSVACSKSYMASAHTDPLRGLIFYHPGNSSAKPPAASSAIWSLDDEGKWKTEVGFPVYAVSSLVGQQMMHQLSLYSGNVTQVPYGKNISDIYNPDPTDYVRIWTELNVTTPSTLPTIWIYFLIIAGVLLVVISGTSFLMHLVQGRRRASLRRRVIAGEVNLEGMGIARLTVPMEHIEKFPLFTYHYEPDSSSPPTSPRSTAAPRSPRPSRPKRGSRGRSESFDTTTLTARGMTISEKGLNSPFASSTIATDYQPTCAICLEAFQNRVTVIRELPCGHIFHPGCIDEFLNENSSLCPLCKACMLPKGYCPKITNAMVRRELAIRRLRDRIIVEDSDNESTSGRIQSWGSTIKRRFFNTENTLSSSTATELQPRLRPVETQQQPRPPRPKQRDCGRASPSSLARQRMRELAGSVSDSGEGGLKRWQIIRNKIFPGF